MPDEAWSLPAEAELGEVALPCPDLTGGFGAEDSGDLLGGEHAFHGSPPVLRRALDGLDDVFQRADDVDALVDAVDVKVDAHDVVTVFIDFR